MLFGRVRDCDRLRTRASPERFARWIDVDGGQTAEIDYDSTIRGTMARDAVTTASNRDLEICRTCGRNDSLNVGGVRRANDSCGESVDAPVVDTTFRIVGGMRGRGEVTSDFCEC
jgi:hypothetical protein